MKRFVLLLILFMTPIVGVIIGLEFSLRNIPNDYKLKLEGLEKISDSLNILILGNSHAYYDVNPSFFDHPAFNMAYVSQTVDINKEIFSKYVSELENIKWLVVSVSYSSLFTRMTDADRKWRLKNFVLYYELDLAKRITDYSEVLNGKPTRIVRRSIDYYINNKNPYTSAENGWGFKHKIKDIEESGKQSADRHTKSNFAQLSDSNLYDLQSMIENAENNGVNVLLFLPPAYSSYQNNIERNQYLFTVNALDRLDSSNENCTFINLLFDQSFDSTDYFDGDHLNHKGAEKLTRLLNTEMEKIEHNVVE